jgi:hypothetical protein
MPRYLIERSVAPMSEEEFRTAALRSKQVIAEMTGVVWIKSYISESEGKIFCEYDAPNEEAIREHARRAGLPVDRISQIALEVSPQMFV